MKNPEEIIKMHVEEDVELLQSINFMDMKGYEEKIGEAIRLKSICYLYDAFQDESIDITDANMRFYKNEFKISISSEMSEAEVYEFMETYNEEIEAEIYERDNSDLVTMISRHHESPVAFYDVGFELPSGSWSWSKKEVQYFKKQIKKALRIQGINKWDEEIVRIINHASYGGTLNIYFKMELDEVFSNLQDANVIDFSRDINIGIVDHWNGSGFVDNLEKCHIRLPFNSENLHLEKNINYNWTYDISDSIENWCLGTDMQLEICKDCELELIG